MQRPGGRSAPVVFNVASPGGEQVSSDEVKELRCSDRAGPV